MSKIFLCKEELDLLSATRTGDQDSVLDLLVTCPEKINIDCYADGRGFSSATYAAYYGHADCLDILLSYGADPNFKVPISDDAESTPLIWAAYNGHLPCVELLLQHGANINHEDRFGYTALMNAIQGNNNISSIPVIMKLLESGASLTNQERLGLDAIGVANRHNKHDIVLLINAFKEQLELKKTSCEKTDMYNCYQLKF